MICKSNLAFANGMFDQQLGNLNPVFFDFEYYRVESSGIARSSSQTPVPKQQANLKHVFVSLGCASLVQKIFTVSFWPPPPVKAIKQPWNHRLRDPHCINISECPTFIDPNQWRVTGRACTWKKSTHQNSCCSTVTSTGRWLHVWLPSKHTT